MSKYFKAFFIAATVVFVASLAFAGTASANTVEWTGNGTDDGFCANVTSDPAVTGQNWLFILTSPDSGPWELTAEFSPGGVKYADGVQMGGGSVHFTVNTAIGAQLLSASATNGTALSNLTVSHCEVGLSASVTLTKTFEEGPFTPAPDEGDACFTLSPAAGSSDATQCTNTPLWEGLTVGDYTISETTTPDKYATIEDIDFSVKNDCTGEPPICVETSVSPTAFNLGTFEDPLPPGFLQILKRLGTVGGPVDWPVDAPSVTFYVCAHDPADSQTELTPAQCNSAIAVDTLAVPPNPAISDPLDEGYYTVCEVVPAGYTVDDQCQVVQVISGEAASANEVTFVNTPMVEACSPGYWGATQGKTGQLIHASAWPIPTSTLFTAYFNLPAGKPVGWTLLNAIRSQGTTLNNAAFLGTAALLDALHADVDYPYSIAQIQAAVNAALAGIPNSATPSIFDIAASFGPGSYCPLN